MTNTDLTRPNILFILTGRIPSQHGIHDFLRAGNSTVEKEHGDQRNLTGPQSQGRPRFADDLVYDRDRPHDT